MHKRKYTFYHVSVVNVTKRVKRVKDNRRAFFPQMPVFTMQPRGTRRECALRVPRKRFENLRRKHFPLPAFFFEACTLRSLGAAEALLQGVEEGEVAGRGARLAVQRPHGTTSPAGGSCSSATSARLSPRLHGPRKQHFKDIQIWRRRSVRVESEKPQKEQQKLCFDTADNELV